MKLSKRNKKLILLIFFCLVVVACILFYMTTVFEGNISISPQTTSFKTKPPTTTPSLELSDDALKNISSSGFQNVITSTKNNSPSKTIKIDFSYVGPSANNKLSETTTYSDSSKYLLSKKHYEEGINTLSKIYNTSTQPSNIIVFLYDYNDSTSGWATSNIEKINKQYPSQPFGPLPECSADNCYGGNTGMVDFIKNTAMVLQRIQTDGYDPYLTVVHEVGHAFQHCQWINSKVIDKNSIFNDINLKIPGWFREGQTHFAAIATSAILQNKTDNKAGLQQYLNIRNNQICQRKTDGNGVPFDYSYSSILKMITSQSASDPSTDPYYTLGYSAGLLAVETMVADYGINKTLQLFNIIVNINNSNNDSFKQAFNKVYNKTSWDKYSIRLASVISQQYTYLKKKGLIECG